MEPCPTSSIHPDLVKPPTPSHAKMKFEQNSKCNKTDQKNLLGKMHGLLASELWISNVAISWHMVKPGRDWAWLGVLGNSRRHDMHSTFLADGGDTIDHTESTPISCLSQPTFVIKRSEAILSTCQNKYDIGYY